MLQFLPHYLRWQQRYRGTGAGPGIYGAIENCKLIEHRTPLRWSWPRDTIKGCILEAGSGVLMLDGGLINNFEDSIITSVICDNIRAYRYGTLLWKT